MIDAVEGNQVVIGKDKIPLGETYKEAIFKAIGSKIFVSEKWANLTGQREPYIVLCAMPGSLARRTMSMQGDPGRTWAKAKAHLLIIHAS